MDTFKEKQELDDLDSKGIAPWQLWKRQINGVSPNGDAASGRDRKKLIPLS